MNPSVEVRWEASPEGFTERVHTERTARGLKVTRYTSRGIILQWEFVEIREPGR